MQKRVLTKKDVLEILSNRFDLKEEIFHYKKLGDIQKAAKRVKKAIEDNEKILIVADYDVDGVVSAAIMDDFFSKLKANYEIYIPNRFKDGYGLNKDIVKNSDASLIITVDNGISSIEASKEAKKRGIDLIITDHHLPQSTIPLAYAIINPHLSDFEYKDICGAQVSWYFCGAIKSELNFEFDLREYLDMLAIAIIADMMPLKSVNRKLVKMGLNRLNMGLKPFSQALLKFLNRKITSQDISFQIAPRLNAAGRIDDAKKAFEFLRAKDFIEAYKKLLELDLLNQKRKDLTKEILNSVVVDNENFLVIKGNFHEGVIGIVASKLVNIYKKPAIVFCEDGEILKGSGRSLGNIDIYDLISKAKDLLDGFGGHKMACGLKIKNSNFEKLKKELNNLINEYSQEDFYLKDEVLGFLPFKEIDLELVEILESFEPYGEENPLPKFISKAKVIQVDNFKDNHYKLILGADNKMFEAVIFDNEKEFNDIIEFKFSINKDPNKIQLIIEEIL